ncbi:unnamed protein product [Cylindrotheca closterium]|uniref:NIF system FeS cluster assembly NifU C-terminal domain-containing protein n=1 Tax=Cylindrotheca closterium TaxID=2856 RepID=A0AAD2FW17_9STRA|nr:unnamed protein product [Cylindrotheca closterium]
MSFNRKQKFALSSLLLVACCGPRASAFTAVSTPPPQRQQQQQCQQQTLTQLWATQEEDAAPGLKAPVLNGKRVLPFKVLMAGLKGAKVAGTYAVLNKDYKRGSEGWEHCQHVGVSVDLASTLQEHMDEYADKMAHVRALTFVVPSQGAMEEIANQWKVQAMEAGGSVHFDPILADLAKKLSLGLEDEDDDDDDDWDEEDDEIFSEMQMAAAAMSRASDVMGDSSAATEETPAASAESEDVISPFDANKKETKPAKSTKEEKTEAGTLVFSKETVDKVLEEVRPYLISDGGNVSVQSVDEATKNVYLKLEGACGSCPSSTVTMKMGIERVLKENFADLGEIIQVEDEGDAKPTELTYQVVEEEVNRIKGAIQAMGGVVNILNVDPIGVVEIEFRGANKVRQGLELALLDIDFVKHVKFVSQE